MNGYCLKCDLETDEEICPQCKTPTIDRSQLPDAIIRIHQLIRQWERIKSQPFVIATSGGRETRV